MQQVKTIAILFCLLWGMNSSLAQSDSLLLASTRHKIDSLKHLLTKSNEASLRSSLFIQIADLYERNILDSVIYYREKATTLCEELRDTDCYMLQSRLLAYSYVNVGKFDAAKALLDLGETHFAHTNHEGHLSSVFIAQGYLHRRMGKTEESVKYFLRALEIKQKLGQERNVSNIYNHIGIAFSASSDQENAASYYQKIIDRCEQDSICFFYTAALNNAGDAYLELGQLDKAKEYLTKSIRRRQGSSDIASRGYIHSSLAQIALAEGDTTEAKDQLNSALQLFRQIMVGGETVNMLIMLGDIEKAQRNVRTALDFYHQAIQMTGAGTLEVPLARLHRRLADCYALQGKYDTAYAYFTKYGESLEQLGSDFELQLAIQNKRIDSLKSSQQIAQLSTANELTTLRIKRQRLMRNGFIGVSGLLAAFLAFVYYQLRLRHRAQQLLVEKNQLIDQALHEKEDLLKEVHHRVKNNLQIVSSMLHLQGRHTKDPTTLDALRDSRNRVNSMALIHQSLYREEHLKGINAKSYIGSLTQSLANSYRVDDTRMRISSQVQPILLDVDTAIPLGLVTNELITNAIKYAFNGQESGEIKVFLHLEQNKLILSVEDNGVGLPPDFEERSKKSYGFQLVRSLARKLKADVVTKNDYGCQVQLTITQFKTLA